MDCKDISNIGDVLRLTGSNLLTLPPDETVMAVARRIDQNKRGMAVVRDAGERMLGVVSVIDINRAVANYGEQAPSLPVSKIMNTAVVSCKPQDRVHEALAKMKTYHIRHLPVVEDGILRGLVTMRDLLQCGCEEPETRDQATIEGTRKSLLTADCH